jgi:hypothetical protein
MAISNHKTHFSGKTITSWQQGDSIPDPATTIPFIITDYDKTDVIERFRQLLAHPDSRTITGLVFGENGADFDASYSNPIVEELIKHSEHLPHLTALFLGDITFEESEISWIGLGDVSPLFTAYPQLEHFGIRGSAGTSTSSYLHLGILHHERLKTLIVETGGMDRSVVHDVLRSHLPALEHLELWTGSEDYGGNCTVEDFAPLFTENLFPNLRYLGLRDSEFTNDLATALSQSPLLERLRVLDLSLGTLDDIGAAALLNCPAVRRLEKLDLHYHFCSEEMMQRLQALGIEIDVSERQEPDRWDGEERRFVAVSE